MEAEKTLLDTAVIFWRRADFSTRWNWLKSKYPDWQAGKENITPEMVQAFHKEAHPELYK